MKIDNNLYWVVIEKNCVVRRQSIHSITYDPTTKKYILVYATWRINLTKTQARPILRQLGITP